MSLGKRRGARDVHVMHSLPIFLRLEGQPVILVGEGEVGAAKRRLLERAGAIIVDARGNAPIAFVALADSDAAAADLKARGCLINVADRPDLCDFTLPAIVDRDPVLVAIGTGGASAGLAAALRQKLETILPADLGTHVPAFAELRTRYSDAAERRAATAGLLDQILSTPAKAGVENSAERIAVTSPDPDDLTLRAARLLGLADRVYHPADMAPAILARARADAARIVGAAPALPLPGLSVELAWRT